MLKEKLEKLGYVKDTPEIVEYKRLRAVLEKKEAHFTLIKKNYEGAEKVKKSSLEEKALENQILEDRIES